MRPVIDDTLLDRMCLLAKLELSDEECDQAKKDLEEMLTYIDCLDRVDVSKASPLYHVFQAENVFREDVPRGEQSTDKQGNECLISIRENAPKMQGEYLVVPRTIGE